MPSLNGTNGSDSIWGQFHFFPNTSLSVGAQLEMEARRFMMPASYTASFTTIGTYHYVSDQPPDAAAIEPHIVLMPSSYDLNYKEDSCEEGWFTMLILSGCAVLLVTVSASVGLVFGLF